MTLACRNRQIHVSSQSHACNIHHVDGQLDAIAASIRIDHSTRHQYINCTVSMFTIQNQPMYTARTYVYSLLHTICILIVCNAVNTVCMYVCCMLYMGIILCEYLNSYSKRVTAGKILSAVISTATQPKHGRFQS